MPEFVTLAERHARTLDRMGQALLAVDAALRAYARANGGRFIRFGSTATGAAAAHSDVDIIADFPGEAGSAASRYAEDVCFAHGLTPDPWPVHYVSDKLMARALEEGIVLA